LRHEGPAGIDFGKPYPNFVTDTLDDLIFVQEVDLAFRRMDINIDSLWVNFEAQICERMATLGQKVRVALLNGLLYS